VEEEAESVEVSAPWMLWQENHGIDDAATRRTAMRRRGVDDNINLVGPRYVVCVMSHDLVNVYTDMYAMAHPPILGPGPSTITLHGGIAGNNQSVGWPSCMQ
jgi:hypothetical protein